MFWHGEDSGYYIGTSYIILSGAPNIDYVSYSGHRFMSVAGEAMRINTNNNVLIGTITDNGNKLQVNGDISAATIKVAQIELAFTTPFIDFHFNNSTSDYTSRIIEEQSGLLTINEVLNIVNNGNVLIGTRADYGYKLQVNGSERVYGDLIVDGEVSALVA